MSRDKDQINLEMLYEEVGEKWSAIVLDSDSRSKLIEYFNDIIPSGWNIISNHMTIDYQNPAKDEELGKSVELVAYEVYGSAEYIAVKVKGYELRNDPQPPHVSIAEAPKHLQSPEHLPVSFERKIHPIVLHGTIKNITKNYRLK